MYKDVEYSFSVAGQFLSDASLNIRRLIEKKRILIRHRSLEKIVSDGRRQDRGQNSFLTPSIFCIACLYVSLSVCRSLSACTSLCLFGGLSLCLYVSLSVWRPLSACTSLCLFGGLSVSMLWHCCLSVLSSFCKHQTSSQFVSFCKFPAFISLFLFCSFFFVSPQFFAENFDKFRMLLFFKTDEISSLD